MCKDVHCFHALSTLTVYGYGIGGNPRRPETAVEGRRPGRHEEAPAKKGAVSCRQQPRNPAGALRPHGHYPRCTAIVAAHLVTRGGASRNTYGPGPPGYGRARRAAGTGTGGGAPGGLRSTQGHPSPAGHRPPTPWGAAHPPDHQICAGETVSA